MLNVAFDVDGTLQNYGEPNKPVITLFKEFEGLGCNMYIWSGEGVKHAEEWRDRLGLTATVVKKGSFVPDFAVDNVKGTKLGQVNIILTK